MQWAQACLKTSETELMANLPKKILRAKLVDVLCMKVFQVSTDYTSSTLLTGTGCKCFRVIPFRQILSSPVEVNPLDKILPYIIVQLHTQCCSLCLCFKSAGRKQNQIWKHNTEKALLRAHSLWIGTCSCLMKRAEAEASQVCMQQYRPANF